MSAAETRLCDRILDLTREIKRNLEQPQQNPRGRAVDSVLTLNNELKAERSKTTALESQVAGLRAQITVLENMLRSN